MKRLLLSSALMVFCLNAQATIIANLEDATNGGGFFSTVKIANSGSDTVNISADIADPINLGLTQGDILSLWFNLSTDNDSSWTGWGATPSLSNVYVDGNSIGNSFFNGAELLFGQNQFDTDALNANNSNLNSNSIPDGWDLIVETGQNGGASGFIESLSFDLTIAGLTESLFNEQLIGMRVQSIQGLDWFAEGSSKLLGDGSSPPNEPPNEPPPPPPPPTSIPEPAPLSLFGLALFALGLLRRKQII